MNYHRRHNRFRVWLYVLLITFLLGSALVQAEENPQAVVQSLYANILNALNKQRDETALDIAHSQQIIEEILQPHIDYISASKAVLGPHWDSASVEQRKGFIRAFRSLLLNYYSATLLEYLKRDDGHLDTNLIEVIDPGNVDSRQIMVRSYVIPKSGEPVPYNYEMNKTRKGWKIFDIGVEGVSVITTYKASYATEIEQKGLDELIRSIELHNKK